MNPRPLRAPRPQDATQASALERALQSGIEALLACQDPAGFWVHELEADVTITSEYLLLRRWLGIADPAQEAKAARHILSLQLADGGWPIYAGGPANISATVKAYFALKMTGLPATHPALVRACRRVRDLGGITQVNIFTRILLALFGEMDWKGVPCMPVELMLLPRWFYFNIYEISYWSRTVLVPLLILIFWIGLYPRFFFDLINPTADQLTALVNNAVALVP